MNILAVPVLPYDSNLKDLGVNGSSINDLAHRCHDQERFCCLHKQEQAPQEC